MIKEAVILAAGEGTRLRPLTSSRPKPMLPVAGKPILEWDLEALAESGFTKACLIVGYKKELIEARFGETFNGVKIEYLTQKEQLGTAHAIAQAEGKVAGEFLVMNGDLIVSKELIAGLVNSHSENRSEASMCLVKVNKPSEFGIATVDGKKVTGIEEKPEHPKSNLANAGVYVFSEKIFDTIRGLEKSERLEYEITDAFKKLIGEEKMCGFECEGRWMDVGRPWDLLDANEIIMKGMKLEQDPGATIEPHVTIKGGAHIGKGTVVKSGSYIEGPCYIGEDCVIGPNAYIRAHSTIMDGARIGNSVEIKNSIVMAKTHICHLSYVGDSIIGECCNFGAGTNIANLRVDNAEIRIEVKNKLMTSGRRKFGCLMGDNVKTGINVSIMPGRAIYPNAYVEAGSVVRNTIYSE